MDAENARIEPATQAEISFIRTEICAFNNRQVPFVSDRLISKDYVVKENGIVIAGIKAMIYYWNILYVDVLFVVDGHRGKNLASRLLHQVEQEAKAVGATLSHLDTFDFQAKKFSLKQGYEGFGVLEDCPPGHQRFYLKKILSRAEGL